MTSGQCHVSAKGFIQVAETGHSTVAHGCSFTGRFEPSETGKTADSMKRSRSSMSVCRKCSFKCTRRIFGRFLLVVGFVVLLFLGREATSLKPKGFQRNLDSFFCSVDQDGNGEICQEEATKFLESMDFQLLAAEDDAETKEGMGDLLVSHHFDFDFSYGGNTISSEEMLEHLGKMMTANHVVDWVTHGLQLPQYAETFRQNAINGMDFPTLIENEGRALVEELGIQGTLHLKKITYALVRQVFGIGKHPGPIRSLQCSRSFDGGIQLLWEPPTNRGVPPLHKYLIQRWSKTSSTWIHVADSRDTAYMDQEAVIPGKNYTYRVQTWGSHGPSNWIVKDGCSAALLSSPPLPPANTEVPIFQEAKQQVIISRNSGSIEAAESSFSTLINTGLILLLALFSRQTFFYDVTSAAWVLLTKHLQKILEKGLESPHLCLRTLARSVAMVWESWAYIQHKVWTLSRYGVETRMGLKRSHMSSLGEPGLLLSPELETDSRGRALDTQSLRSSSTDSLPETVGHVFGSFGDLKGISPSSSEPASVLQEQVERVSLLTPSTPPQELEIPPPPAKRSKNRCNHEGCKVRFDRWHYLHDWWMKLNKHYCRECQSFYCLEHTRISPHGPRGQCGLDSCYCFTCFATLPLESRRMLEKLNKLRVGPPVHTETASSLHSTSTATSSGIPRQKVSSLSGSSLFGSGLPSSLNSSSAAYLEDNGFNDSREALGNMRGVSKAASDSGIPDAEELVEQSVPENGKLASGNSRHRRQSSCA